MSYTVNYSHNFHFIEKSSGFSIEETNNSDSQFSITYLTLQDSRDPENPQEAISINPGFQAIYLVIEGTATLTIHDQTPESMTISKKDFFTVNPGTVYSLEGSAILALVSLPAFNEEMFSHPVIE